MARGTKGSGRAGTVRPCPTSSHGRSAGGRGNDDGTAMKERAGWEGRGGPRCMVATVLAHDEGEGKIRRG